MGCFGATRCVFARFSGRWLFAVSNLYSEVRHLRRRWPRRLRQ